MNENNYYCYNRRSIRRKDFDYSKKASFFITFIVKDRKHLYGEIIDGKMYLNDAGRMIERWYNELENKFPDVKCYEMVIMPNHFHCIIDNLGRPREDYIGKLQLNPYGEHKASPLFRIVQWFKTMSTNEYIRGVKKYSWERFNKKLWHRNYWEHIIRNPEEYVNIANYIKNNPKKWDEDKYY